MTHAFRRRWLMLLLVLCIVVPVGAVLLCDGLISSAAKGRTFDRVEDVPMTYAALVLGTSPTRADGAPNRFFVPRMKAAARLYHAGRVTSLIVSGDNSSQDYDEPTAMKNALMALGVPEDRIVCDYAGLRTLDSVVRAREVFGQRRFTIVSQRFHNERAIYLALGHGLDAYGLNASSVPVSESPKAHVREVFARVKAVLDVHVLGTRPRHLGPQVPVP